MLVIQKRQWLVVLFVIFTSFAVPVLGTASSVFADYTPTGDKCDDGSAPAKTSVPNSTQIKLTCSGNPDAGSGATNDGSTEKESCAIERVGWIICPVIYAAAVISDKAFDFLADNFLRTDPQLIQDDSGTKTAWELARNIANIMFIVAFLVIIISQVTSMGISNYGIKRMIPRLLVAAIAVNASYYICQLAVDLTNILGYEIKNALTGTAQSLGPSVFGSAQDFTGGQHTTGIGTGLLTVIAVGALGAAAVVWLTLPLLISVILFVLISVATIIVILLLRKALIVLLIVVSPIAFVLYLLPNTERLFNKWTKMFGTLLMVFPVVGLLLGAGQLASTIVLVAGSKGGEQRAASAANCNPDNVNDTASTDFIENKSKSPGSYDSCGSGAVILSDSDCEPAEDTSIIGTDPCKVTASWTLGLVAMGIAVAPLIAVWAVLKGALSATGSIGGKLSSMSGRFTQGRRKSVQDAMETRRLQNDANYMDKGGFRGRMANGLTLGGTSRRIKRKAVKDYAQSGWNKQYSQYVANEAINDDGFAKQLAGGAGASKSSIQRVITNAESTQRQAQAEEFKASSLRSADMTDAQLHEIVDVDINDTTIDSPAFAAAIDELGKRGDFGRLEKIMNAVAGSGKSSLASRTLASTLNENMGQVFTGGQIANIARGGHVVTKDGVPVKDSNGKTTIITYKQSIAENLAGGVLNAEKAASLSPSLAGEISHVAASATDTDVATHLASKGKTQQDIFTKLANASIAAQNDPILNKRISRIEGQLTNFSRGSHSLDTNRSDMPPRNP